MNREVDYYILEIAYGSMDVLVLNSIVCCSICTSLLSLYTVILITIPSCTVQCLVTANDTVYIVMILLDQMYNVVINSSVHNCVCVCIYQSFNYTC